MLKNILFYPFVELVILIESSILLPRYYPIHLLLSVSYYSPVLVLLSQYSSISTKLHYYWYGHFLPSWALLPYLFMYVYPDHLFHVGDVTTLIPLLVIQYISTIGTTRTF